MIKELLNCEIHWTQVKTDTNGLQMLPEEEFNFKRFRDLIAFLFYFHFFSFVMSILFYFCINNWLSVNLFVNWIVNSPIFIPKSHFGMKEG